MRLFLQQETRTLTRPTYFVADESGNILLRAKSRFLNILKKIDVTDEQLTKFACIAKTLSIVPKFKIDIHSQNAFIFYRKFSIHQDYEIRGRPLEVIRNVNNNFIITANGKKMANIQFQGDLAHSKYEINISDGNAIIEYVCIILAMDLANKMISRVQYRN